MPRGPLIMINTVTVARTGALARIVTPAPGPGPQGPGRSPGGVPVAAAAEGPRPDQVGYGEADMEIQIL